MEEKMATELLPCPFCASRSLDATCSEKEKSLESPGRTFYYVFCESCDACGPCEYEQAEAIRKWNVRREHPDE